MMMIKQSKTQKLPVPYFLLQPLWCSVDSKITTKQNQTDPYFSSSSSTLLLLLPRLRRLRFSLASSLGFFRDLPASTHNHHHSLHLNQLWGFARSCIAFEGLIQLYTWCLPHHLSELVSGFCANA